MVVAPLAMGRKLKHCNTLAVVTADMYVHVCVGFPENWCVSLDFVLA